MYLHTKRILACLSALCSIEFGGSMNLDFVELTNSIEEMQFPWTLKKRIYKYRIRRLFDFRFLAYRIWDLYLQLFGVRGNGDRKLIIRGLGIRKISIREIGFWVYGFGEMTCNRQKYDKENLSENNFPSNPTHSIQCCDTFKKIRNKCFSENWNEKVETISDKYLDWTKIQILELRIFITQIIRVGNAAFL